MFVFGFNYYHNNVIYIFHGEFLPELNISRVISFDFQVACSVVASTTVVGKQSVPCQSKPKFLGIEVNTSNKLTSVGSHASYV